MIGRRCVFFIGGYDPKTAEAFFARMAREARRFETTWQATCTFSPVRSSDDGAIGTARIETSMAAQHPVETDFVFLSLNELVLSDFRRPLAVRLLKYLATALDYLVTGTGFSIFARSWRFGLYSLYPLLAVLLFAAAGVAAALAINAADPAFAPAIGALAGIAVFFALLAQLGGRGSVLHLFDLWSFSRGFLRGRRPDAEALMQRFAQTITTVLRETRYDEVLLVGHSTGGGLVLDVTGRALEADPDFPAYAGRVSILTLGSTGLKFGLHPAATVFRRRVQAIADDPRIGWTEVQCLTDVINFYRTDPIAEMGLRPRPMHDGALRFPAIVHVRMRDMLDDAFYGSIKRDFFRIHYQFVFGNTKRYFYDFLMICCGPQPLSLDASRKRLDT